MTDIAVATKNIIKHSVTADNYQPDAQPMTSVVFFGIAQPVEAATPGLPPYYSRFRDYILSSTILWEDTWSAAVNKQITKNVAMGWRVEDKKDSGIRIGRASELLQTADGSGWNYFAPKNLQDYFLTDNGAFIEIVRSSSAAGSKILGICHLDSLRCTRTSDRNIPLLYRDYMGREHELKAHQVVMMSDQPSSRVELNNIGFCAASRAFRSIVKLMSIETYFREKITGDRVLAIHIVSGVSAEQINNAVNQTREDKLRKGYVVYKGSVTIPTADTSDTPSIITIPLAEVPDGFSADDERKASRLAYSNALGMAFNDLEPLSHQGFGQGKQSEILDEAATQGGPAALWRKQIENAITRFILPDSTTFFISTNDVSEQKKKAEVAALRGADRAARITAGEITPAEARQIAANDGDLPQEMLGAPDQTLGGSIDDNEKPITISDIAGAARMLPIPSLPTPAIPLQKVAATPSAVTGVTKPLVRVRR